MKLIEFVIGGWLFFMVLAIVNAGIRNWVYKQLVGDLLAHQISTFIFIIIIFFVTAILLKAINIELSDSNALFIGVLWLFFTVIFEFIAGHYVFGNSWEKLFADYNILKGRIWSLVLLTILFAPYISKRLFTIR